jgi:hypothetical protein
VCGRRDIGKGEEKNVNMDEIRRDKERRKVGKIR